MLTTGDIVAGYRIDRVIGAGRMGTVFLARNPDLPRDDALKVINPDLLTDAAFRERFAQEGAVAAGLTHPNIVPVYRRGTTDDGLPWIAMQYVAGADADTALRQGTMTTARAVHIITEIAKALDYAHRRGVVHRDVKPANFLLSAADTDDEHVLLTDFGVACPTRSAEARTGPLLATVAYAAPEVLTGATVDSRADIYSLGASLYRLLTGRTPATTGTDRSAPTHLHSPLVVTDADPTLPGELNAVIATAMATDPAARYPSARDLAAAATAALNHQPSPPVAALAPAQDSPEVPIDPWDFPAPPPRHRPTPRQLQIAAALAGLAALTGVMIWSTSPASDQPTPQTAPPPAAPTTPATTRDTAAENTLLAQLPQGYPSGACTVGEPTLGARAEVTCGPNRDLGGPSTSRYLLMPHRKALQQAFDTVLSQVTVQICPGNFLSPGPWRRLATPDLVAGTVLCGTQGVDPTVVWTTDDRLLLNVVTSTPTGPSLEQLYREWWASHS